MESYNIIIIFFGIICLISLAIVYFINRLIQAKIRLDSKFESIKSLIEIRVEIISSMLMFINENLKLEKNYAMKLSKCLDELRVVRNDKEGIDTIKKTKNIIFKFNELENTYINLAKNKKYLELKNSLIKNQEELVYSFDTYNKEVVNYNSYISNKFIKFLSKLLKFREYSCYN